MLFKVSNKALFNLYLMKKELSKMSKTIRVYAVGGFGINMMSKFAQLNKQDSDNFAKLDICYVDTSASNLRGKKDIDQSETYLFEGLDGSGKIRASNATVVSKNTLDILQKFQPGEMNLVVHSGSGGSGSVAGPAIVSELKKRNEQVIVIVLGSTDTIIETKNSYKTLETYEAISKLRNSCTAMYYLQNSDNGRQEADTNTMYSIGLLCGLYSGNHAELDTADLKSWLNIESTVSPAPTPTIASLSIHDKVQDIKALDKLVSVATLATPSMSTRLTPTPPYQAVGFVPSTWCTGSPNSLNLIGESPIHFCISFDLLKNAYADLKNLVEENEAAVASRSATNTGFSSGTSATDNGLVL
jgi:hypothetical protein